MQRLYAGRRIDLPRFDHPQPHGLGQRVVLLIPRATKLHLAIPQRHHGSALGLAGIARRQFDHAQAGLREVCHRSEQHAALGQPAVLHGAGQHMDVGLRHRGPFGVDVRFAIVHHCLPRRRPGVTIAAGFSTCLACAAASSQRIDSRSAAGRL